MTEIYKALNTAMNEICRLGIGKLRKASAGGANYHFRGIEDAMNEMSPILVRNGIVCVPRFTNATIAERAKGDPAEAKALRFATVLGVFTFFAQDGSSVTAEAYGEAMDSGDKALIKAQSVALRTALFDLFMVPTMSMDPESTEYDGAQEPESLDVAREQALQGVAALETWWKAQTKELRVTLASFLPSLKQAAAAADAEAQQ